MSAQVSATSWGWYCYECDEESVITYDSEFRAESTADEHNKEFHS